MSISLGNDEVVGLAILGVFWLLIAGAVLTGLVRRLLLRRQIERSYRLRLAAWRAAVDGR